MTSREFVNSSHVVLPTLGFRPHCGTTNTLPSPLFHNRIKFLAAGMLSDRWHKLHIQPSPAPFREHVPDADPLIARLARLQDVEPHQQDGERCDDRDAGQRQAPDLVEPLHFRCAFRISHCAQSQIASTATAGTMSNSHQYDMGPPARLYRKLGLSAKVSSVSCVLSGGVSCMEHCRSGLLKLEKPTDQMIGRPTKWSALFSLISLRRFGRQTPRHASPLLLDAVCVPPNAISAANENGPAMPSLRSSPKSSSATPCGTSKSVHGHRRRAF